MLCKVQDDARDFILSSYAWLSVSGEKDNIWFTLSKTVELVAREGIRSVLRDIDSEVAVRKQKIARVEFPNLLRFQLLDKIINRDLTYITETRETLNQDWLLELNFFKLVYSSVSERLRSHERNAFEEFAGSVAYSYFEELSMSSRMLYSDRLRWGSGRLMFSLYRRPSRNDRFKLCIRSQQLARNCIVGSAS